MNIVSTAPPPSPTDFEKWAMSKGYDIARLPDDEMICYADPKTQAVYISYAKGWLDGWQAETRPGPMSRREAIKAMYPSEE